MALRMNILENCQEVANAIFCSGWQKNNVVSWQKCKIIYAGEGGGELHGDLQREGARPPRPHVQRQDRAQGSFPYPLEFL
jgi:hypothetical protein